MSASILRQGKLWGLFACHHYAPHHVPFARRTAAELFGQMFSLLMESRERDNESAYEERAQKLHHQLITVMANEATQFESIVTHLDDLADLLACDGIGVWINDRPTLKGLTPDETQFAALIAFLAARNISEVFARHDIGAEYPAGRAFSDRAAGMLVVPLSRPARDYLIFFRKEVSRNVNWAGDPSKSVTSGPLGARLTPRKSFELWRETVSGQSPPWLAVECRIAEALRVSLLEVILRLSDLTETERRRAQERQELLIAELNHRVRNILGLIRGVITQSKDFSDRRRIVHQGGRRPHPRLGDGARSDHGRQLGTRVVSRPDRRGSGCLSRRQGGSRRGQRRGCADRAAGVHHGRIGDPRDDHQFGQIRCPQRQSRPGRDRDRPRCPRAPDDRLVRARRTSGAAPRPARLRQHCDRTVDPPRPQGRCAGRLRTRRSARVVHDPGGLRPHLPRRSAGQGGNSCKLEQGRGADAEGRARRRGQHDHRARCRGHDAQIRDRHGAQRERRGPGPQGDFRPSA